MHLKVNPEIFYLIRVTKYHYSVPYHGWSK